MRSPEENDRLDNDSVRLVSTSLETSKSLLRMLGQRDDVAWRDFARRYSVFLRHWCDKSGIPRNDSEDLIQETFLKVLDRIPKFEHRGVGSFRSWIKSVAWHCWCDLVYRGKKQQRVRELESFRRSWLSLQSLEAGLEKLIRQELLDIASASVRERVAPKTWDAFWLLTMEGLPGPVVAERLEMQLGSIYTAKCRVQNAITQELRRLESES